MELTLLALVQHSHCGFKLRGVAAEGDFNNAPSFWSQLQELRSPVGPSCSPHYQSLFLQAIDGSSHRADGERHLALDLGDCERALMQQRFERREIREAQSGFLDATLRDLV